MGEETTPRYAGPIPRCPRTLDDEAPELTDEMLRVPTSELYSVALEAAWQELERGSDDSTASTPPRPTSDRVAQLEPNSKEYSAPRPRHYGPYAVERASLDWSYHVVPSRARQALQDEIVSLVLEQRLRDCKDAGDDEPCRVTEAREGFREEEEEDEGKVRGVSEEHMGRKGEGRIGDKGRPLALFTAGGMGAGKGHTLRAMLKNDTVRLPSNTVWIDPDALSRLLPERPQYLKSDPSSASALLHPEASLLQEIIAAVAREQRRSLVVDGSLTDCQWFEGFMRRYHQAGYDCEILFVSAPEEVMLKRAEKRAKSTGRVTNPEAIKRSRIKSPECVTALSKPGLIRRVRLIDNSSDSSTDPDAGPTTLYDSALDPEWPNLHANRGGSHKWGINEPGWIDAKGFVKGELVQGEDGRVRRKDGRVVDAKGQGRL
ncbi:hypothetical protein JCM10908_002221 [Rhodotorula pacifica]|uniref:uncharacterized protein n=1 Tax=Rhodotorula pacifica TaxID=1495444 RepID=UPI0031826E70